MVGTMVLIAAWQRRDFYAGRLDPLRFRDKVGGKRSDFDLLAGELLDIAKVRPLVIGTKSDRHASGARPRGAADAVDILLGHMRQLEVDHVGDAGNVDAARRDVGC